MNEILSIIELIGKEFVDADEDDIQLWIKLMQPLVSKKVFGESYNLAVAYLVCHKMKLAGYGDDSVGGINISASMSKTVSSISEGGSSISFQSTGGGGSASADAEYEMTRYGSEFLQLKKSFVVPITISQ